MKGNKIDLQDWNGQLIYVTVSWERENQASETSYIFDLVTVCSHIGSVQINFYEKLFVLVKAKKYQRKIEHRAKGVKVEIQLNLEEFNSSSHTRKDANSRQICDGHGMIYQVFRWEMPQSIYER